MKTYPSIPNVKEIELGVPCIAFRKYDGSNLRFEWNHKSGWYKYGTRTRLFDHNDPEYGKAIAVFHSTHALQLSHFFGKIIKCQSAIAFCEWFGPNSFAGVHDPKDEKQLVLFDVNIHKKGFVEPEVFVDLFNNVPSAEVIYRGKLNEDFVERIRTAGPEMGEGVICKGGSSHKLWMCKIKTLLYLEELKKRFQADWKLYWE